MSLYQPHFSQLLYGRISEKKAIYAGLLTVEVSHANVTDHCEGKDALKIRTALSQSVRKKKTPIIAFERDLVGEICSLLNSEVKLLCTQTC